MKKSHAGGEFYSDSTAFIPSSPNFSFYLLPPLLHTLQHPMLEEAIAPSFSLLAERRKIRGERPRFRKVYVGRGCPSAGQAGPGGPMVRVKSLDASLG